MFIISDFYKEKYAYSTSSNHHPLMYHMKYKPFVYTRICYINTVYISLLMFFRVALLPTCQRSVIAHTYMDVKDCYKTTCKHIKVSAWEFVSYNAIFWCKWCNVILYFRHIILARKSENIAHVSSFKSFYLMTTKSISILCHVRAPREDLLLHTHSSSCQKVSIEIKNKLNDIIVWETQLKLGIRIC